MAVAACDAVNRVYVYDETTGKTFIYDGASLSELGSLAVESKTALIVDEQARRLYLAAGGKIAVMDAASGQLVRFLPVTQAVGSLMLDADLRKLYAWVADGLIQIDLATDSVTAIPIQGLYNGGILNPVTHEVFLYRLAADLTEIVNGVTLARTTVKGVSGFSAVVNWKENKVYFAMAGGFGADFRILDRKTNSIKRVNSGNDAMDFLYNPAGNRVYTTSEINGIATIFEGQSDEFSNLPLGLASALGVRHSTNHVYFAGRDYIGVLDDAGQMLERIPVVNPFARTGGALAQGVAINQVTGRVYVINDHRMGVVTVVQDTEMMMRPPVYVERYVVDPISKEVVETQALHWPITSSIQRGAAVRPGGGRLYIPNRFMPTDSDLLTLVGTGPDVQQNVSSTEGLVPLAVAVAPDGSRIYVTNSGSNDLAVFDSRTRLVTEIAPVTMAPYPLVTRVPLGKTPWGIAVTPDGSQIYVANQGSNSVSVVATGNYSATHTIPVGASPWGVAVNPSGSKVYVANSGSGTVSIIDTASQTVIATVTAGSAPHWLAVTPDGNRVFVSNSGDGTVSVIDAGTDTLVRTVAVGGKPEGVAALPSGSEVYVANDIPAKASLSVITTSDYSVSSIALPANSRGAIPVTIADPTARFAGRLRSAGRALSGVLVRALQGGVEKGSATTNAAGDYSVSNLKPGTYDIQIAVPGGGVQTLAGQTAGAGRVAVLNAGIGTTGACTVLCAASVPAAAAFVAPVLFSASAVGSNCPDTVAFDWDFGDGSPRVAQRNPAHGYLDPGVYPWTLTASAGGAACAQSGRITVAGVPAPYFRSTGIVNAASYSGGPVAPGEIISIFGADTGPAKAVGAELEPDGQSVRSELAGTRLLFDGVPAPLLFASATHLNAVVPYSVAGKRVAQLELESAGKRSVTVPVSVASAAPGLFSSDSSGTGPGVISNQDGKTNSAANPAPEGSVVTLYATGIGQTNPPGVDGKLATEPYPMAVLPLSLTMGGRPAGILYAGAAPGAVSGVAQINARVPAGLVTAASSSAPPTHGSLPLRFEANHGQHDPRVKFSSRGAGYTLFLTDSEAVLLQTGPRTRDVERAVVRMRLVGASGKAGLEGLEKLPGISNYFQGPDPSMWRTSIPNFAKVRQSEVYRGIDLVYYGNQGELEYDLVVKPGGDPASIELAFEGADEIRVDDGGDLLLRTALGEIRWKKPLAFQEADGVRRPVATGYLLRDRGRVAFRIAPYRRDLPLTIDPVLVWATYLGGGVYVAQDEGKGIAVDGAGNTYVTGWTNASDFPIAGGLRPASMHLLSNAFVAKLDTTGSTLLYSTYFANSMGSAIAVDRAGNAYVTGWAGTGFPTANALQPKTGGDKDAFVAKLNASGSTLVYSTFLGGSGDDRGAGIAVDGSGNANITGRTESANFPTANALQSKWGGKADAFVAKLNPAGSALVYSTYLGGSESDIATGIALGASGAVHITGSTSSDNFPTANALQAKRRSAEAYVDAFVTKLNPDGSALLYSTYLGGSDGSAGIAVDLSGNAYIAGFTTSSNFPTVNALQPSRGDYQGDAFVAKLNPSGSALVFATYLGGTQQDTAEAIAVDTSGNAYVTGRTNSPDFPRAGSSPSYQASGQNAFVVKLNPAGSAMLYSTYVGGRTGSTVGNAIAVDFSGNAYVTGLTGSDFPVVNAFQPAYGGGFWDAWVAKIASTDPPGFIADVKLIVDGKPSNTVTLNVAGK